MKQIVFGQPVPSYADRLAVFLQNLSARRSQEDAIRLNSISDRLARMDPRAAQQYAASLDPSDRKRLGIPEGYTYQPTAEEK
jgi:hypothetical protein